MYFPKIENNLIELENISNNKLALQSSFSKWSKPDDPLRPLNPILDVKDFSFHTDKEDNPWWMLDLQAISPIEEIHIYNRKNIKHQAKAYQLKVEYATHLDGVWELIHAGFLAWGEKIVFPLSSFIQARYIKISMEGRAYLHLWKVEVFKRKYPGLIVAGRGDGLGGRLKTILNALYLAEKTGFQFAYIWPITLNAHAGDFLKPVKVGDAEIVGHAIQNEQDIFSSDFIQKYSKQGLLPSSQGVLRKARNEKINFLSIRENFENEWGWYAPLDDLNIVFSDLEIDDLHFSLKRSWNKIKFNQNIEKVLNAADRSANDLEDFFAVHIRTGDLVYGGYRLYGKSFMRKALPFGLAEKLIGDLVDTGKQIILFGDETSILDFLKHKYGVKVVADYYPFDLKMDNTQKSLFEMKFMSSAKKIFSSGNSVFSGLAQIIAGEAKLTSVYQMSSPEEQYHFLRHHIDEDHAKLPPLLRAFDCHHCYILGLETKVADDLFPILEKATILDPENPKYIIYIVSELIKKDHLLEAEKRLSDFMHTKFAPKIIEVVAAYGGGRYFYAANFKDFERGAEENLPFLSYIASVIKNKLGEADKAKIYYKRAVKYGGDWVHLMPCPY